MPCSAVRMAAISPSRSWTSSRIRNISSVRRESETSRQAGNAAFAAATARPTSSRRRSRPRPSGLRSPGCRPARSGPTRPRPCVPSIQWLIRRTFASALAGSLCDLCHEVSLARLGLPHGAPRVRDLRSPAPRGRGMRQRRRREELERRQRLRQVRRRRGAPRDEGAVARARQPDGAHVRSRPRAREGRVPAVPRPRAPRRVRERQAGARPGRDRDRPRQPRTSGATRGWTESWSARA